MNITITNGDKTVSEKVSLPIKHYQREKLIMLLDMLTGPLDPGVPTSETSNAGFATVSEAPVMPKLCKIEEPDCESCQ